MVAVYEELVRPRVMAAVGDLATRRASGVLEVAGNPSGSIYLDGGHITFAQASWAPGLAVRLRAVCPGLAGPAERQSSRDRTTARSRDSPWRAAT